MRLVVCPLIVLALLKGFSLLPIANAENILLVSLIAALTPPASTVMQLAQINDCDTDFALSANILSTLLCIITMPLITALFLL
jgi:predicted permease